MPVAEVRTGKLFYTATRPMNPRDFLPKSIRRALRNVTPRSLEMTLLKRLDMKASGEKYDSHPLLRHLHTFPQQNACVITGGNREVFYFQSLPLENFGAVRQPSSIVMCDPFHYLNGLIKIDANAWSNRYVHYSRKRAVRQWKPLLCSIIDKAMPVDVIPSVKGLPAMVFVDQGLAIPSRTGDENIFVPSKMKKPHRKGEVAVATEFFRDRGYDIRSLEYKDNCFESNGDCHVVPGIPLLLMGFGDRSSVEIARELEEKTGYNVLPFELTRGDISYHFDTVSSIVNQDTLLLFPKGLRPESLAIMLMLFRNFYLISRNEAFNEFTPNSKVIGDILFTQTSVSNAFLQFISKHVKEVMQFDMSEFNKAGGGINCCSKLAFHVPPGSRNF